MHTKTELTLFLYASDEFHCCVNLNVISGKLCFRFTTAIHNAIGIHTQQQQQQQRACVRNVSRFLRLENVRKLL